MKKVMSFLMLLSLGMFTLGCATEEEPTTDAETTEATEDTGETTDETTEETTEESTEE